MKYRRLVELHRVVGRGMWPVLESGQLVLVQRKQRYSAEDVVLLWYQGRERIKRIIMLENGKYDVRGDNPHQSTDSRQFGLIEKHDIIGKVIWPRV